MTTTKTPNQEALQSQTSADGLPPTNNNSSELIQKEEVPNTPFNLVTTENGTFLAMGIIRLTEDMQTKEEVLHYLANNTYNIIVRMIGGMTELNNQFQNSTKTKQQ